MNRDVCQLFYLKNPIQNYAWGSRTAIAALQPVATIVTCDEAVAMLGGR